MTAGTREQPAPSRPEPGERAPRSGDRSRAAAWLDGPLLSAHLVFGAAGLLLAIGLVMVFSASSVEAALAHEPAWAPGVQQTVFALLGTAGMFVVLRIRVGRIRAHARHALLGVLVALVLVLVPGIGLKLNGARQWFDLGFANLQPSEVAKLVFGLWGAHVLATRGRHLTVRTLFVPVLPVFAVLCLLLIAEPDFGSVVTLGLVLAGLLWAAGMPLRYAGWAVLASGGLITLLIKLAPYRAARVTSFLDPFADPLGSGLQAVRGMYALATGGLTGVGLGNSRMKWDLLPHAESDYIFAIIGEELGFLGCCVVILLYGVLAYAGFRIARRSTDRFIQLASTAITVWLVGQAAMNMGYVVGLLPVTGVTLPLISAGGTSLVLTLAIVGLLGRFALSEPEAIAHRGRTPRRRLARLLLPLPEHAVDPVHVRRPAPARRTLPREAPGRSGSRRGSTARGTALRGTARGTAVRGSAVPARSGRPPRPAVRPLRTDPPPLRSRTPDRPGRTSPPRPPRTERPGPSL